MKRVLFALVAMLSFGSVCFAQGMSTASTSVAVADQSVMGKVQSVTLGDAAKKVNAEIVIVDKMNKEQKIAVMPATVITDKEGKMVTLDKVANGTSVSVKYMVTKEGVKEALTINIEE